MAFSSKHNCPIPNLVELSCRAVEANQPDAADLHVNLMVQPDEFDIGEFTVDVTIRAAVLCVETHGCDTDPNSKYGARKNAPLEKRKKKTERMVKAAVANSVADEAVIGGKFDGIKAELEASIKTTRSASRSREVSLTESEEREFQHFTVEAIGADRWRISHAEHQPLRGQYVSDERLCRLVKRPWPSNRFGSTISTQVRKRDVDVAVTRNRKLVSWGTPNRDKILALMVTQSLRELAQDQSDETITFATSEVNDEG